MTRVKTGWMRSGENGTETFLFDSKRSSHDLRDNTEVSNVYHIDLTLYHRHFVERVSTQELDSRNGIARSHFWATSIDKWPLFAAKSHKY